MTDEQKKEIGQIFEGLLSSLESGEGMNLPEMIAFDVSRLRGFCERNGIVIHQEVYMNDKQEEAWIALFGWQGFVDWENSEFCPLMRVIQPDDRLLLDI